MHGSIGGIRSVFNSYFFNLNANFILSILNNWQKRFAEISTLTWRIIFELFAFKRGVSFWRVFLLFWKWLPMYTYRFRIFLALKTAIIASSHFDRRSVIQTFNITFVISLQIFYFFGVFWKIFYRTFIKLLAKILVLSYTFLRSRYYLRVEASILEMWWWIYFFYFQNWGWNFEQIPFWWHILLLLQSIIFMWLRLRGW